MGSMIKGESINNNEGEEIFVDKDGMTHFGDHGDMFEEGSLNNTFTEVFQEDNDEETFIDSDGIEHTGDHGEEYHD